MKKFSSEKNPFIKHLILLRKDVSYRKEQNSVIITGKKIVDELVKYYPIKTFISTEQVSHPQALQNINVTSFLLKKITGLISPDGVAAEFSIPHLPVKKYDRILICDHLQDPGNLGTLFRSALAFNFNAIFLLNDCVDPFNDKALRASKGAVFFLPFKSVSIDELKMLKKKFKLTLFLADMSGCDVKTCSFSPPFGIIIGNEGHGANPKLQTLSQVVALAMNDKVDSLNAAVCGSLLMYLSCYTCQTK